MAVEGEGMENCEWHGKVMIWTNAGAKSCDSVVVVTGCNGYGQSWRQSGRCGFGEEGGQNKLNPFVSNYETFYYKLGSMEWKILCHHPEKGFQLFIFCSSATYWTGGHHLIVPSQSARNWLTEDIMTTVVLTKAAIIRLQSPSPPTPLQCGSPLRAGGWVEEQIVHFSHIAVDSEINSFRIMKRQSLSILMEIN